jgi:DNA ligase (NAD+)
MDGAAVSLTYRGGVLAVAATRGDGAVGEEITHNVRTIKSLPTKIAYDGELILRGEVFIPKAEFERINNERTAEGLPLFANPRNAAAGSLKLLDSTLAARRGLDMRVYGVATNIGKACHTDDMAFCKELGFPINELNRLCRSAVEVQGVLDEIESVRFSLPYEIDGAVIKVNEYQAREQLGSTGKFPRWAVAYKYQALQATTRLNSVSFQVGRTGAVTPVAELEPVLLSGSTISRATLHNEDEIARLGVMIGDTVFIEKGGEIIPKVVKVVLEKRPTDATPIEFPKSCPECGVELIKPEGEVRRRCPNIECKARIKAGIGQFVSRNAMDIEGIGESLINALVDEGRLASVADIYTLQAAELAQREKMGDKSAGKLIESIERSRNQPFSRVLFAIGLPQVGVSMSRVLASNFGDIDRLMNATAEQLTAIKDVGGKTAELIMNVFATESFKGLVERLRAEGLQLSNGAVTAVDSPITGKNFLVTGTLTRPRKEVEETIISHGGTVAGSVSKTLNYLIVGEKAGSKLEKAQKLNIPVISEEEFYKMI